MKDIYFVYLAMMGETMLPKDNIPTPNIIPTLPPHLSEIQPPMI